MQIACQSLGTARFPARRLVAKGFDCASGSGVGIAPADPKKPPVKGRSRPRRDVLHRYQALRFAFAE